MGVTIGFCGAADVEDLTRFIDAHWQRGHALAVHRPLLDWQHRQPDGSYAFVIARDSSGAVAGMLGFIETARYDPALADDNVVWLTTWKVRDDASVAGLGLSLLRFLTANRRHTAIGAVGLTASTMPIYAALRYRVGELDHYVCRRQSPPSADGADAAPLSLQRLVEDGDFMNFRLSANRERIPRKTPEYFRRRYGAHPVYRYVVAGLRDRDSAVAVMAARIVEHQSHRALRIVDFVGDESMWPRAGRAIAALLEEHRADYADVYNAGIDQRLFVSAGFERVDPAGAVVVPDHFEPYEHRNVRLFFALKGSGSPVLFKGDGDQDRPSRLEGIGT
jgi:hypothetical protein